MHVDRKIQKDLERILEEREKVQSGSLILLCGSVGDGKSHLLAYLKDNKPEQINKYTIFNDATESFSPDKDAMETLEEVLKGFSDEHIDSNSSNIILAINLGVLHKFINLSHKMHSYNKLKQFVENSNLFTQNITTSYTEGDFSLLSFGDYHSYELTEDGPVSSFYTSLVERICVQNDMNPFYLAFKEDKKNGLNTIVHNNYAFLCNTAVQTQIVNLIIRTIIEKKLVISARAFLNFIADILIPDEVKPVNSLNEFEILESSLPNLIFNRKDRSVILEALFNLDPVHRRSPVSDHLAVQLNTLDDWSSVVKNYIEDENALKWINPIVSKGDLIGESFYLFLESFIRITYLVNKDFAMKVTDPSYYSYTRYLYYLNIGNKREIKNIYEELKTVIFKWRGSPGKDYIYMNQVTDKVRLAQKIALHPSVNHFQNEQGDTLETFKSIIQLSYRNGEGTERASLDIDFPLYQLLVKVNNGYKPNSNDLEDGIRFVEFIEKLMQFGNKQQEILVCFPNDQKFYTLKRDDFDVFVFERE